MFSIQYVFLDNDLTRMPWGQDESDLVWINLDKESKTQRNQTKKTEAKKHQKNTVFQTSLNMPKSK